MPSRPMLLYTRARKQRSIYGFQRYKKEIFPHGKIFLYCSNNNIPVIVLEGKDMKPTIKKLRRKVKNVSEHRYIKKCFNDGFTNPQLSFELEKLNIDSICLMWVNASYCVMGTAIGAINMKYNICTARQLIADPIYDQRDLNQSIQWYKENGIYADDYTKVYGLLPRLNITK